MIAAGGKRPNPTLRGDGRGKTDERIDDEKEFRGDDLFGRAVLPVVRPAVRPGDESEEHNEEEKKPCLHHSAPGRAKPGLPNSLQRTANEAFATGFAI
jgi:hypothetical protein